MPWRDTADCNMARRDPNGSTAAAYRRSLGMPVSGLLEILEPIVTHHTASSISAPLRILSALIMRLAEATIPTHRSYL